VAGGEPPRPGRGRGRRAGPRPSLTRSRAGGSNRPRTGDPITATPRRRGGAGPPRPGNARAGDQLSLADAAEIKICVLLSISTLAGLGLYALTGAALLDPVADFSIAAFAIHEGREAWHGELVENNDEDDD
jgi:hypothetical protein